MASCVPRLDKVAIFPRAASGITVSMKRWSSSFARRSAKIVPHWEGCLAAAYGLKGRTERASAELAEARLLSDGRYSTIAHLKAAGQWQPAAVRNKASDRG